MYFCHVELLFMKFVLNDPEVKEVRKVKKVKSSSKEGQGQPVHTFSEGNFTLT